jgi:hypothetical protein
MEDVTKKTKEEALVLATDDVYLVHGYAFFLEA